jgi:hypothetical protein
MLALTQGLIEAATPRFIRGRRLRERELDALIATLDQRIADAAPVHCEMMYRPPTDARRILNRQVDGELTAYICSDADGGDDFKIVKETPDGKIRTTTIPQDGSAPTHEDTDPYSEKE